MDKLTYYSTGKYYNNTNNILKDIRNNQIYSRNTINNDNYRICKYNLKKFTKNDLKIEREKKNIYLPLNNATRNSLNSNVYSNINSK